MVDVSDFDTSGEEGASAPSDRLDVLNEKLATAFELESVIEQAEADLAALKQSLNGLKTVEIPDLMTELQMDEVTRDGWKVKLSDFVSGSLPKEEEKKAAAIKWLEENEGGELLKTSVSIAFAKSQHEDAVKIHNRLISDGYGAMIESGVHSASLQAFARERIKNGDALDIDVLGLYTGTVAKIMKVKPKVTKAPKAK